MRKKLFLAFLIAVILLATLSMGVYYAWDSDRQKQVFEEGLSSLLERPVHIGDVDLQVFPSASVILRHVTIRGCIPDSACLTVERMRAGLSVAHLFQRLIYIDRLVFYQPRLSLVRDANKRSDLADIMGTLFRERTVSPGEETSWIKAFHFFLEEIVILDGKINVQDYTISEAPRSLTVDVDLRTGMLSSAHAARVTFSCTAQDKEAAPTISFRGFVGPIPDHGSLVMTPWRGNLEISDVPIHYLQPYLKGWNKGDPLMGRLDAKGWFDGAFAGTFRASGAAIIRDLLVRQGSLFPKPFTADSISIEGSCVKRKEVIDVPSLTVNLPQLSMAVKGAVNLAFPWHAETEVRVGHLNYEEYVPYLPVSLLPEKARTILTEMIKAGSLDMLSLRYVGNLADFPQALHQHGMRALDASLVFRDMTVRLAEDLPLLKEVQGKLSLDNGQLAITDVRGVYGDSAITRGSVTVSSKGVVKASAAGDLDLLDLDRLLHMKKMSPIAKHRLRKLKYIAGEGRVEVAIAGPLDGSGSFDYSGIIAVSKATLDYQDFRKVATDISGHISFNTSLITIERAEGLWAQSPFQCKGRIQNYRSWEDARIQIHVSSDRGRLPDLSSAFFPWLMSVGDNTVQADIDFFCQGYRKEGFSFSGLARFENLVVLMPSFPYPFTDVKGSIAFSSGGLAFHHLQGTTGTSKVSFVGEWRNFAHPVMTGTIEGELVDFSDFLTRRQPGDTGGRSFRLDNVALLVRDGKYKQIDIQDLRAFIDYRDGKVELPSLHVRQGSFRGFDFENVHTVNNDQLHTITYHQGVANIPFLSFDSHGGTWYGMDISLPFQSTQPERFMITSRIRDLPVEEMLKLLSPERRALTGTLDLDGVISGMSQNPAGAMSTLEGSCTISVRDGILSKATILSKIFSLLNVYRIFRQDYTDLLEKGLHYDKIDGSIKIEQGIARTEGIVLDSASMKMHGVGELDIANRVVDMEIAVQPLETVDKVLGKIPIVGTVLMGKEGAFIVTYYKLQGPLNDPQLDQIVFQSLGRKGQGIFRRIFEVPENIINVPGKPLLDKIRGNDDENKREEKEE